jgi:hypothetical protein
MEPSASAITRNSPLRSDFIGISSPAKVAKVASRLHAAARGPSRPAFFAKAPNNAGTRLDGTGTLASAGPG